MKRTNNYSDLGDMVDHSAATFRDSHVVVGPAHWQPSDGTVSKIWYFMVATADAVEGFGWHQTMVPTGDDPYAFRAGFFAAFAGCPVVLHDVDDELYMARLCEGLWPCAKATRLRMAVEAERATV